jgi:hypothetical protein
VLNHLRAQCLLATVYARAGLAEAAVRHAEKCLALGQEAAAAQTPLDRATTHGCASAAYAAAGRVEEAGREHGLAARALEDLEDPSDAAMVRRLYPAPQPHAGQPPSEPVA